MSNSQFDSPSDIVFHPSSVTSMMLNPMMSVKIADTALNSLKNDTSFFLIPALYNLYIYI